MIGDIDLSARPRNPQLFLCKPTLDRVPIAILTEAYNIQNTLKFGNINELSFSIPFETLKYQESIPNKNIPLVKERYLVKYVLGDYIEWYRIDTISDAMDDTKDVRNVRLFSLGIELSDKMIKRYSVTSYNASHLLNDVLRETLWRVGYVDADFDLKYRSMNIDSATVLESVYNISSTFQSIVLFDTQNRLINLYKPDSIGKNRGLTIKYGKYLKSLNKDLKVDEIATRLRVEGKDGLSIQRINPTGSNFLEDFSHFIYPAVRDPVTKVITKSSDYWTDSLVSAQLAYQDKLVIKKGEFATLLSQKTTLQTTLTTKQNELTTLNTDMAVILDNIDVAQAKGDPTAALFQQRDYKQADINAKKAEITTVNTNIANVDTQISALRTDVALENNFTAAQINERNQYIIEKEWSDQNYTDDQQLYDDALKKFDEMKVPQTIVQIDIVNFFRIVEAQRDWDRLVLGDIIGINYDKINVDVTAKIIEAVLDFDNEDIKLTIANVKDIERTYDKWVKMMNQVTTTSTSFDMNRSRWDTVDQVNNEVTGILNDVWKSATRAINSGVNESVTIDRRGITNTDPTDPLKFVRITHGVIGLTNNGGVDYKQAITADGIIGERIFGKLIAGVNLIIDASDSTGTKTFTVDSNGVTIRGASLTIEGGLPESQIDPDYINRINNSINQLELDVNNMLSDGQLTTIEENVLERDLAQIKSESTDFISSATTLNITTEKTNYQNAVNDLDTYLTTNFLNKPSYPISITTQQRTDIKNKMSTVQSTKSVLINKISVIREANSKTYTDQQISEVNASLTTLENNVDQFSSDNVITLAEANSLKLGLNQVKSESTDLVNVATILSITTEKTNYSTALTNLETEINKWIDKTYPLSITATDRSNVKTKFNDVQNNKSILINKITAVREANSKTYTDQQISEVNTSLTTLGNNVDAFSSDSVITLAEANSLKLGLNQVNSESTDLVNIATTLSITTENTNYSTALTYLQAEINKWIDKTYPLSITTTDRTNIKTKFNDVQNNKSILINKITAVREQRAKDASVGLGQTYNGVQIDSTSGLVVTKSDATVKTTLNATEGIKIEQNTGTSQSPNWVKKFYANTSGGLVVEDLTAKKLIIQDSAGTTLIDTNTKTLNFGNFSVVNGVLNTTNIPNLDASKITTGTINANIINVTNINASNITTGSINANNISVYNINASNITAGTINGISVIGSTVQTASTGTRVQLNGGYGDVNIYNSSSSYNVFRIQNNLDNTVTLWSPSGNAFYIGASGNNVYAYGNWNFGSANVSGLIAKFG